MLADLALADYDPWSLPTAEELALSQTGSLGLSVDLGDPVLSVELHFENNPFEGLFSSSMTTIAALGIVAAIAVPAYQDYTLRAHVGIGFAAVAHHKTVIAEFYQQNGRHMNAEELADSLPAAEPYEGVAIEVEPDTGVIYVYYADEALGYDPAVVFTPQLEDGGFSFACSSTMETKYLPKSCRDEY